MTVKDAEKLFENAKNDTERRRWLEIINRIEGEKKEQDNLCMIEKGMRNCNKNCAKCGFNYQEAARRRLIPLTLLESGLYGKVVK